MTCDNYYHPDVTGKGTPNMKPISNNKNAFPHRGLRKVMALALAFLMLVCGGTLSAVRAAAITAYKMPALDASDAEFKKAIEDLRSRALASCGRRSFNGYCAWYVNLQLYLLGINAKYVTGDGKDEFNNYRGLRYSSGGYKIHAYPEDEYTLKSSLAAIIKAAGGKPVRNVLTGFSKAGGDGEKYGHTFFIHLIRDGYVFFSDSFGVKVGGTYYPEGKAIKCTVDELFKFYAPDSFIFDGVIWFEDENETPVEPSEPKTDVKSPSVCRVVADGGLRVRSGPGTGFARLALIPDGTELYVTEISADGLWGRVFYDGSDGWSSLEYMEPAADPTLPAVVYDHYEGGAHIARYGYSSLADAVTNAAKQVNEPGNTGSEVRLLLTRTPGNEKITLTDGISLDCAAHGLGAAEVKLDGGELRSDKKLPAFESDPFVNSEASNGKLVYTSAFSIFMRSASLSISDNVAICFGATITDTTGLKSGDITVSLVWRIGDESHISPMTYSDASGSLYFNTDGIPPKKMADSVYAYVLATATDDTGRVFERRSEEVNYSVTRYAANMYGGGTGDSRRKLDKLLSAMMGYGAAAQKYFGYNTASPADSVLPEEGRTPPVYPEDELFRRAGTAPVVNYSSTAHITSASLELLDRVGIRMRATGLEAGATYRLLVWTQAEVNALGAYGAAADELLRIENRRTLLDHTDGVFVLDGISAKKLADTYYFRLCEIAADGTVRYDRVITYSVTTYCANKAAGSDELAGLCRALAVYSAAAREYFGYTVNAE